MSATSKPTNSKDASTYRKKKFFCKLISKNKSKPHKKPRTSQKVLSPPLFKLKQKRWDKQMESKEILLLTMKIMFTNILFGPLHALSRIKAEAYTEMGFNERIRHQLLKAFQVSYLDNNKLIIATSDMSFNILFGAIKNSLACTNMDNNKL